MNRNEFTLVGYKTELTSKTRLVDIRELPPVTQDSEAYRSVYAFRPSDFEGKDSLRDISSDTPVYCEFLPIDLDNEDDLEGVWKEAKEIISSLESKNVPYRLYFTGRKGFHILIPTESFNFQPTKDAEVLKRMALAIAGEAASFDTSIYNKSRVFRVPYSYNKAGNKYKIPCSVDQSLESILLRATSPETPLEASFHAQVCPYMVEVYKAALAPVNGLRSDAINALHTSFFMHCNKGARNDIAYTMARKLAKRGIAEVDCYNILVNVWNKQYVDPPLTEMELSAVISNAYKKGMIRYDDSASLKEISFTVKDAVEDTMNDLQASSGSFMTGFKAWDEFTMGHSSDELIWISGRSGNFKTSLLTKILLNGSKHAKKPAIFFSMEMGKRSLIPRLIQMSEHVNRKTAIQALKAAGSSNEFKHTTENFDSVKFVFKSGLTTESMLNIIDKHMEKYGPLSAIGIDYLSLFKDCNNNTERTAKQAQELKTIIAKQAACPVFCLTQAKQIYEGRYGDIELDRRCPKDSDSILDLGDFAFGIWGNWQSTPEGEQKEIYGRFFKSRGYDEEVFGNDPYFGLIIDRPHLDVRDVVYVQNPPQFKQVSGE